MIWEEIMTKTSGISVQSQPRSVPSSRLNKEQALSTCTAVENLKKEFPIDEENKESNTPSIARRAAPTPRQPTHMELRSSLEREANNTAKPSNEWGQDVGFSAPISPMDPSFRPGINKNIQGAAKIPLNDYLKYTAGTSQQAVQAQMGMTPNPYFKRW